MEETQVEKQMELLDTSRYELHCQGAEARVWSGKFLNRPVIIKQRFSKKYRHPQLDLKLTLSRVRGEIKSLLKARKLGVSTPALYHVDIDASTIIMEHINGKSVKAMLREDVLEDATAALLMQAIAEQIVKLHDGGLVHGDLTTSNMLVVVDPGNNMKIIIIDFGLSYNSTFPEDKAVDLYVLERAFASAHAEKGAQYFEAFMDAYKKKSKFWSSTFNRFAEVRMRGRKRAMIG